MSTEGTDSRTWTNLGLVCTLTEIVKTQFAEALRKGEARDWGAREVRQWLAWRFLAETLPMTYDELEEFEHRLGTTEVLRKGVNLEAE